MEIADPLPELGEMVPVIFETTVIEYDGRTWLTLKLSQIPAHEVVRVGFKLYCVGDYSAEMEAFEVTQLTATITQKDLAWLRRF